MIKIANSNLSTNARTSAWQRFTVTYDRLTSSIHCAKSPHFPHDILVQPTAIKMPPKKAQSKKAEPETQKDENKTSKKDETKENERSQGTKRKIPSKSKPVEITTTTIRKSEYTYFLLEM